MKCSESFPLVNLQYLIMSVKKVLQYQKGKKEMDE